MTKPKPFDRLKAVYRLTYSSVRAKDVTHLPVTSPVCYRSAKRAFKTAERLQKAGRNVCVSEFVENAWLATYTWKAGNTPMEPLYNLAWKKEIPRLRELGFLQELPTKAVK
jgi:hypothetical protein